MKVKTKSGMITNNEEARSFVHKYGLYVEFWKPEYVDEAVTDPLIRYEHQIGKLKKRFRFAHADVCELNTKNPDLDKILAPFAKEHHHTDDEIRFTVEGSGIFGVNPITEPPFEVYVESGDLLVVPANARHWFNLTEEKNIRCIRVFKDNPKWEAIYETPKTAATK